MQPLDVAGELLDAVDLAAALDLDGDDVAVGVAADEVDRADRRRVLAADERQPDLDGVRAAAEQLLQVGLDAVLLQAGIDARARASSRRAPRAA